MLKYVNLWPRGNCLQVTDNFVSTCVTNLVDVNEVPKETLHTNAGALWTTEGLYVSQTAV